MTVEEFQHAFDSEIKELLARIQRRYSVTNAEVVSAVHASAKKYVAGSLDQTSGNPGPTAESRRAAGEFLSSLNADDLCLAAACAKGDDAAWEDFSRYRAIWSRRSLMTQDAGAAELADSTFAELYGCANPVAQGSASLRFTRVEARCVAGSAQWSSAVGRSAPPVEPISPDRRTEDMDRLAHAAEARTPFFDDLD
jgi:hypothetical protein